ncbi:MAG: hypothetical protein GY805_33300, partial [Chloroflexi bacterium]|nr:hypothetical protein [Chloroflexota bacterium]
MPHTTTDIDRLLQRGQVNESQLVEILVDQYYAQIQHLALNILRNPDDAEDATQETFITAITKID